MVQEDLAESMKEKEWEMRKRRALQDMLHEYEQARRQEILEVRRSSNQEHYPCGKFTIGGWGMRL
jgi:hypothetical protein